MTCAWCEDEELAMKMLHILLKYKTLDRQTLKKAITDFYFCTDCINTYHRLKNKKITSINDLEVSSVYKLNIHM